MGDTTSAAVASTGIPASYLFLNAGEGWPALRRETLEGLSIAPGGGIELRRVPGGFKPIETGIPPTDPALPGGGAIAIGMEGDLYFADPVGHRVWYRPCLGEPYPLPCLRGPGAGLGELRSPAGVALGSGVLYIADSGNHRIQVVDLASGQVRAAWGQPGSLPVPAPSTDPGRFVEPSGIAVDSEGNVYVSDPGAGRIQAFTGSGRLIPAFAETLAAQPRTPSRPGALAMLPGPDGERLLVLDAADGAVLVYALTGEFDAVETARWGAAGPATAVAANEEVFLAGTADGLVRAFGRDGALRGEVRPFPIAGAIVALAFDCHGRAYARHAGGAVVAMDPASAFLRCGTFLIGPVDAGAGPVRWQRVAADVALPPGTHMQLFTLSSDTLDGSASLVPGMPVSCAGPPAALALSPGIEELVPRDRWRAAPAALADLLALNEPARYLWLAGVLEGDGLATPLLNQLRVDFNRRSWMRDLPAVYQREAPALGFADRLMLLFEAALSGATDAIDNMAQLFDPHGTPDTPGAGWLDWLAGWLDLELPEAWPEQRRRDAVAAAFRAHGRRGTVESLRELIEQYAGARVHIDEPARSASIWSLGESSLLGAGTMLAAAHADGAVLGRSATLDLSHLTRDEDFGAPLFEDLAHRFCVSAYAVDVPDERALARVREVIDREKPAHTVYDLCLIEARMRVGFQAQVGVDSIVAGSPGAFVPGGPALLGLGTALPAGPAPAALAAGTARLGEVMTIV